MRQNALCLVWPAILILACCLAAEAQRIAVLTPDDAASSQAAAETITGQLSPKLTVLDAGLASAAFAAVRPQAPFNMDRSEAKRVGTAIGCDSFIVLRSTDQRRSAFGRPDYVESYAAVYVVSSRTGGLLRFDLISEEASTAAASRERLDARLRAYGRELSEFIPASLKREMAEAAPAAMEEPPPEGSPAAKGFRLPIPYRRLKPEYSQTANLYEVAATVDIIVDLDASGTILRTDIQRWAGFGLDESVDKAVRAMNWRPAERSGKSLPMRFLLRYNFKKLDKEQPFPR